MNERCFMEKWDPGGVIAKYGEYQLSSMPHQNENHMYDSAKNLAPRGRDIPCN